MNIIRDKEMGGLAMIPLLVDWKVKRCNVKDCKNKPNTIITATSDEVPVYGLCEEHFQQANVPGGTRFTLDFDNFDAFKQTEVVE